MFDDDTKKDRREAEPLLRQFLKIETGLGNSPQYRRGWVFNFEFTQQQRDEVNRLMESGVSFDEAFDRVRGAG